MSTVSTPESLKEKAKVIRKFMKEKCNVDVSHGHCIELISQLFGFRDWNTASAALKSKLNQDALPDSITTAGEMRRALEPLKDSAIIALWDRLLVKEFITTMSELDVTEGIITSSYSLIREECGDDKIRFQLKLEHQRLDSLDGQRIM